MIMLYTKHFRTLILTVVIGSFSNLGWASANGLPVTFTNTPPTEVEVTGLSTPSLELGPNVSAPETTVDLTGKQDATIAIVSKQGTAATAGTTTASSDKMKCKFKIHRMGDKQFEVKADPQNSSKCPRQARIADENTNPKLEIAW